MEEDKSIKDEEKEEEKKDIPTSSKEKAKAEVKPKLKSVKLKRKKYPIILVAENHLVYKTKNRGNVWVRIKDAKNKYKVLEEYEV